MNSKAFLKDKIEKELTLYYKSLDKVSPAFIDTIVERWTNDSINSQKDRFAQLSKYVENCSGKSVLDMSSGCGSFVIQGLIAGWDIQGIEPEEWKQELIDLKFKENNHPKEWRSRIKQGIGEELPFEDASFEAFNSWQTFEHVQDVSACLNELHRVLKTGGKGIINCPSYMTFYEGHYKLFWLPMMGNSGFGKFYVKMRGRPVDGLRTFVPISHRSLIKKAKSAGFKVENLDRKEIFEAGQRKFPVLKGGLGKLLLPVLYQGWKSIQGMKRFGRTEKAIQLLLSKK